MVALLGVYALGWQQVLRHIPLSAAYANKAVTVVWGCVWGLLLFREQLTPGKLAGGALVLAVGRLPLLRPLTADIRLSISSEYEIH